MRVIHILKGVAAVYAHTKMEVQGSVCVHLPSRKPTFHESGNPPNSFKLLLVVSLFILIGGEEISQSGASETGAF